MGKGRQAPKKYSKMGYFEKQQFTRDQAKKFGVELKHETVNGRHEQVDWEASNAAVAKAAANDYDTRRSIEAAQMSGNKKAQKLGKGINNIQDAVNAERFMAKTHVKKLGATGKYSSANDEGNVTNYWVNKDRDKLTAGMSADEQQQSAQKSDEPYTPSTELADARKTVEDFDNKDYGVYGNSEAGDNNDQRKKAAGSFLEKYKLDVKAAANFKPTI